MASQTGPGEMSWTVEPSSSVLVPKLPLSPIHRTATRASDSFAVRQWQTNCMEAVTCLTEEAFFSPFPCHSTSYNITWFAKNAFWNCTGSCCLTFRSKQGGRETAFPHKGLRKINSWKQLKLVMLTEVKTWRPNPVDQCVYFFLLNVWEKMKLHSYCLSVGAGKQSKCWCGCMCAECFVIVRLWHQALQHVSIVLCLNFFRSNLRLLVHMVLRACMSTYSIIPLLTHAYIMSFCKEGL